MSTTLPSGIKKFDDTDNVNRAAFNENWDTIDGQLTAKETPSGAQAKVDAHATSTAVHGATNAPTANRIISRDAAGRAQVAAPSAAADIARKDTVDAAITTAASDATGKANAVQSNLMAHIGTGGAAHAAATTSAAGFMSAADKSKLDGVTAGAGGAGSATDAVIGNRTISDASAPTGDSGNVTTLLGWLGNMIKAITGKSSWRTAPRTTLENAVKLNGDTMTGPLVLSADPTAALGASTKQYVDAVPDSMARQALINGNFDVWQRGTSFTIPAASQRLFTADRWNMDQDAAVNLARTFSRQQLSSGELLGSYYYLRANVIGAGTGYTTTSYARTMQGIEYGTRYLCGAGKRVTISFWARSSIAGKRIAVCLGQQYGTGGSPTGEETVGGATFTLTSSWAKYNVTISTNTLAGKTFGTNNDDQLVLQIWYAWGSAFLGLLGAPSAETWGGSGNVDIAQVQVNAGDTALPFPPRSYAEELALCQRYYEKSYNDAPGTPSSIGGIESKVVPSNTVDTAQQYGKVIFKVTKRINPTVTVYPFTTPSNTGRVSRNDGTDLAVNTGAVTSLGTGGFSPYNGSGATFTTFQSTVLFHWSADAEL